METVIYVVQQGDTLTEIAKKYHTTVNMIERYKGIVDTDVLEVDRVLRIPVSTLPCVKPQEYTIQSGDTLAKIAETFGTTVEALAKLNGIADPDTIFAGDILKLPFSAKKQEMTKYIVEEGDTLWKIAKRFNVKVVDLINLNRLTNPDCIAIGQVIIIPE